MNLTQRYRTNQLAFALTLFSLGAPVMQAAPILTVVARTGVQTPGENAGINFREFNGFEIGNWGRHQRW